MTKLDSKIFSSESIWKLNCIFYGDVKSLCLFSDFDFWTLPVLCATLQWHPETARRTNYRRYYHHDSPHSICKFHR